MGLKLNSIAEVERARRRGFEALSKKPVYGPDLRVEELIEENLGVKPSGEAGSEAVETASRIGLDPQKALTRGYVQVDEAVLLSPVLKKLEETGVVVMPTGEALARKTEARRYYWRILDPGEDKFSGAIAYYWGGHGYFIYVPPGVRVEEPLYACLFIARQGYPQILHNIVVLGENSELHLITGCATARNVTRALHLSATEIYVGRGARLTYTMIHSWAPQVHVRPKTAIHLCEASSYTSYYVISSRIASIQMYPKAYVGSKASFTGVSIAVGRGSSYYDIGGSAEIDYGSSAEIISRMVAWDESVMISRARIHAKKPKSRGHIECTSLKLSPKSRVETIPELSSETEDSDLSHEAAIGMIAEEELEYLQSRGMSEDEALAMILKGFMSVENIELPVKIRRMIDATIKLLAEKGGL